MMNDTLVINETIETIDVVEDGDRLAVADEAIEIIEVGLQGDPGPVGPPVAAVVYDAPQALSAAQQAQARANIALDQVDNTSDAAKPVSAAQAAADALRVLKAGDTMTGSLLATGGVADLGAPANQWRDGYFSGHVNVGGSGAGGIRFRPDGAGGLDLRLGDDSTYGKLTLSTALIAGGGRVSFSGDTGLSRTGAGVVAAGNGTAGDASGIFNASRYYLGGAFDLFISASAIQQKSTAMHGWSASTNASTSMDVAFSRGGPGQVKLGNGVAGDATGQLVLAGVLKVPRTVATLPTPTSSIRGLEMVVSDAQPVTYYGLAQGGGSSVVGVRCTGAEWRYC